MSGHDDDARVDDPRGDPRRLARHLALTKIAILVGLLFCVGGGCAGTGERIEGFKTGRLQTRATGDLKRGMNFGDAMDAPNEGDWGWTISSSDFQAVRAAGFDHV